MNLVKQTDYPGAIEEFEKALEDNPRNASARFELGWLYEDKASDPAAAIYNYERYLKFSSTQDKADLAKQHITSCKIELTKSVSTLGPQPSGAQRELDRITPENRDLRAQKSPTFRRNWPEPRPPLRTRKPQTVTPLPSHGPTAHPTDELPPAQNHNPGTRAGYPVTPLPQAHTYTIKQGDTRGIGIRPSPIM